MDRRAFFRRGTRKVAEVGARELERRVERDAQRWIRPPFALGELDFLTTCTRCGACTEACPEHIIFPLSGRLGARVLATPALDLNRHACRLCKDWPCVEACEPGALNLVRAQEAESESEFIETTAPRIARARVNTERCLPYQGPECGACQSVCPIPGALVWDLTRPSINPELCIGCAQCREACVVEPKAVDLSSLYAAAD